jgi:protein-S-isoprenylcysteine O-methyltransferase Ste14
VDLGTDLAPPCSGRIGPGLAVQPPLIRDAPVAGALFCGSIAIWIASELRIRSRHAGGTGTEADRGSRVRLLVLVVVGIVVAFNLVSIPHTRLDGWWPVGLGVALVVGGIALRQWSVAIASYGFPESPHAV